MTPTYTLHVYRQRISALFRTVRGLFAWNVPVIRQLEAIEEAWRLSRAKGRR